MTRSLTSDSVFLVIRNTPGLRTLCFDLYAFYVDARHLGLEFRVNVMTLGLDDATATNSRLEAIGVEVQKIDIGNGLPVREEEFHSRCCNTLDGLEVTHIGICLIFYKLVEEHTVDVFSAEGVHHLGEVLHVDGPALINHILGDSRKVC